MNWVYVLNPEKKKISFLGPGPGPLLAPLSPPLMATVSRTNMQMEMFSWNHLVEKMHPSK